MLLNLLFCILCCCNGNQPVYWEDFTDEQKQLYFNSGVVDEKAHLFYNGEFNAGDDEATFELLDNICEWKNSNIGNAFDFMLLCRMLAVSDGALSEAMAEYSVKYLRQYPLFVLEYLYGHPEKRKLFSSFVGANFSADNELDMQEYNRLKSKLKNQATSPQMQRFIDEFLEEAETHFLD